MKALELPDTTLPSGALSSSQASLIASAEGAAGAHADGGEKLFHLLRHFSLFFSLLPSSLPASDSDLYFNSLFNAFRSADVS